MHYTIISTNYDKDNIIVFNFKNVLLPGMYNLSIIYTIKMSIIGKSFGTLYINEDGYKEWLFIIDTQSRKQQIIPFLNEPKLKIIFDITTVHHSLWKVLSNMPIQETEFNPYNDEWIHLYKNVLISIDNIIFVVTDFYQLNSTETISMWCRPQLIPHAKFALNVIKNVTMYLKNYWINSKRLIEWTLVSSESKVDHVAIPNVQDESKQTLGFIFHREADIIYNEELDYIGRKTIIAPLVARNIIQKYIGNLLNSFYWFELWLNEGFIIFLQTYIIDEIVPDFRMMDLFIVQIQHELLDLNTYVDINSVVEYDNYPENYMCTFLSHIKGSIIWRMLERTLSPSIFLKGINVYFNIQLAEPMETTSDNLWKAMQSVINELDSEYQLNVKSMVHSWAMQRCFSVLQAMRNNSSNFVTISVQFPNKLDEKQYYMFPVTYTTESKSNFTITWSNIWLTPSNSEIELFVEKDQWIILNLQQIGYYRVNYDTENWQKIARYLNSEKYKNIHVLNRAQIIDDAFHFVIERKLKSSVFWELATYLQKETDYIAWYPMLKAFEFMSNIFILLKSHPRLKVMLKSLELTWNLFIEKSNDDHIKYLKQELTKWKCIIDDIPCRTKANQQLQWHLTNKKNKLLPGWKRWTYCNGLKTADTDTWNKAFNDSIKEIDHTISECLVYKENYETIMDYIKIKAPNLRNLPQSKSIKQTETLIANIFLFTLAKNTKYMLKNILNDFRPIIYSYKRIVSKIVALTVMINNIYSQRQLGEVDNINSYDK
ncbi:aminopeptidase N-like [Camponotus floridanus]|uniref:aminopeptidase N-like n=1 Tax=Camponotus floridanus TaxID=104421 RepID=UPI000DC66466|nr:aminopeptidase N-like [Camponotus floridanus]